MMKLPFLIWAGALVATVCWSDSLAANWVDIWNGSPVLARFQPPASVTNPNGYFRDTTIRQTLHLTLATDQLRVKLSNEFGTEPLEITTSSAALTMDNKAGSAGIDTNTLHKLTYGGNPSVTIPAGGDVVSDTINLSTNVYQELTISLYLAKGQIGKTPLLTMLRTPPPGSGRAIKP